MAALHVAALKQYVTTSEIQSAIDTLPAGINEMYAETLKRIEGQAPEVATIAKLALLWVAHAKSPIHFQELVGMLATSYEVGSLELGVFHVEGLIEQSVLLAICGGLIVVEASGLVRFIREFSFLLNSTFLMLSRRDDAAVCSGAQDTPFHLRFRSYDDDLHHPFLLQ